MDTIRLFIYGTLKRGMGNNRFITGLGGVFVGEATTVERRALRVSGLPFLSEETGIGHHVQGELWDVPHTILDRLDTFEGHPNWYKRTLINVRTSEGEEEKVFAYLQDVTDGVVVENFQYA